MSKKALIGAAGLALALATPALANEAKTYTGGGVPAAIPDNNPTGITRSLFVPDNGAIKDMQLNLTMNHTWVGDLFVRLRHVDTNTTVTIFNRPGVPEFSTVGYNVDLSNQGQYRFADFFTTSWETTAQSLHGGAGTPTMPHGDYRAEGNLRDFANQDKFGTWEITVSDHAGLDTGSLVGWQLVIFNVPAPGAVSLLGVAGLVAARRRR